ncbi:DUF3892 domain-containing protein [Streptomyces abyssomicinicus]|uniref:DUF3892 domain-containing protein n=1 Tax=Streptomyces abyssomicinicus TaxID=574929 RepID=UPI0013E09250|nr:DUF3892 domain-containing protein [Streptomyces abyssomicinicus]
MSGLTFLSWVREGLAAAGGGPDRGTGDMDARNHVVLRPRLTGRAPVDVPARLLGPGDVTGVDTAQILRTFPAPDTSDAEPHLLPAVEFDRPDLPWMFTPAGAGAHDRLRPWLVLVVVEAGRATLLPAAGALPVLRCAPAELPDLTQSWAWAHAQVTTEDGDGSEEVDRLLSEEPDRTLSRLLCPRRLRPHTRYLAAVVPAFEAGRLAGLGLPVPDGPLTPAWPAPGGAAEIDLPVYHHWTFGTGQDGDFESLVRALTPRALPGDVGTRPMDVGAAGHGLPALTEGHPGRTVDLEGALRGAGTDARPWDKDTAAAFRAAYTSVLDTGPDGTELTPPVYGAAQAGRKGLPSPQAGPTWLRELNLDPRHRAAAALGAEVVRRHQEDLVAAAWDQAAELRRANETLRQGQLARTVSDRLHRRLPGTTPLGTPADDDAADARLLQMTAAARAAVHFGSGTAAGELARNAEAAAALDPALRRLLRPGGPVARRAAPTGTRPAGADTAVTGLAAALARRTERAVPELATPPGLSGIEDLPGEEEFDGLTADRLTTRWWETNPTHPREGVDPVTPVIRWVGAALTNRVFVVTTDGRLMSRVTQGGVPGWVDHGTPPGTTASSAPVACQDLHVFVTGADGTLRQLFWDGDRWVWLDHGKGGVAPLHGGDGALAAAVRRNPPSGPSNNQYLNQTVYCADTNGVLHALRGKGANWSWEPGRNPGGRLVRGVRVVGPWALNLLDNDGKLSRWADEGAGWTHTPVTGMPDLAFDVWRGVPDGTSATRNMGTGVDGVLQISTKLPLFSFLLWQPVQGAPSIAGNLGRGHDDRVLLCTTDARILACSLSTTFDGVPVGGGRVPGAPDQALVATVTGSVVHAVAGGILWHADRAGDNTWRPLGAPVFGGKGAMEAAPPRDIRWRPQLGFFSNLLVAHVDAPAGANTPYLRFGRSTDFDGTVRGGWALKTGLGGRMTHEVTQGFGVATADLDRSGRPDVVLFWIEETVNGTTDGNFGRYTIGRDLDANGDPARWVGPVAMPSPMSTPTGSGGALTEYVHVGGGSATLADLDGDGNQELIVVYLGGFTGNRRLFLRIGWNIDPDTGLARGGWEDSVEIPWPGRPSETAPRVRAVDVAVADLDQDLRPELIVMLMEENGGQVTGSYRVGWRINARGKVTGGWSNTRAIPGSWPAVAGAGIAVADFSGSEKPDLAVLVVADGPTDNSATYRVGWDVEGASGPRTWSAAMPAHPGGWYGWLGEGAGLALVDLPDSTAQRRTTITANFRTAAKAHQRALLAAQARADQADEPAVPLSGIADAVRAATDPEQAVTTRVTARIDGADLLGGGLPDPLGPLLAPPSFGRPMAELLTDLGADHLLPGVRNVPPETVTLLRANGPFIEAFLAGANHELGRELLWREFPTDRSATSFRHFWDARGIYEAGQEPPDVPPMRSWERFARLGETLRRPPGGDDAVVLLIRGELVRRFPSLGVHARQALAPLTPGGPRRLDRHRTDPVFWGTIGEDVLFLGFPFTAAEALGEHGHGHGVFFVFEEHPGAPAFGLDVPPADAAWGAPPAAWQDASWASVAGSPEQLETLRHLSATALDATPRPVRPGESTPPQAWGHNAAAMARITLQRPVRVAHHASALLPAHGPGLRVTHVRKRIPGSDAVFVREIAGRHPDGGWWRLSAAEALDALDARQSLYIETEPGHRVALIAASDGSGGRHLRTVPDEHTADNLLSLPPIPDEAYRPRPDYPSR